MLIVLSDIFVPGTLAITTRCPVRIAPPTVDVSEKPSLDLVAPTPFAVQAKP